MSQKKILIVDDEPQMTKLLKLLLEDEMNCEVKTCNDSTEALELMQNESFDLISLDHRMPKLTGIQLLSLLRTTSGPNRMAPVLIFTGHLGEVRHLHPETFEHVLLLEKPIKDGRFIRNVQMGLQMQVQAESSL